MSTLDSPAPEVTSHAGALTYTAAMSAAAADTVTSLDRTLAAMRRGSVHSDALAHLANAADDARQLAAALADAHQSLTRHDTVREAYAAAGDAGDKDWMTSDAGGTAALQVADAGTPAAGTPAGPPVPDVFGISDVDEKYHSTDTVSGIGDTNANLALYCSPSLPGLALIEVNTSPGHWHPTNADKRSTIDPLVSPREARKLATLLDDLVTLGRSGARVSRPTRLQKTAEKLSELLGTDPDACLSVVGDGGEDEISARDLHRLLALVPKPDVDGRRRLPCKDAGNEMQSDDGTVHAELLTPAGGTPTITVSAVEGNEPPDKTATARLNLDGAAELAGKLRCFADAADAVRAGAWSRRTCATTSATTRCSSSSRRRHLQNPPLRRSQRRSRPAPAPETSPRSTATAPCGSGPVRRAASCRPAAPTRSACGWCISAPPSRPATATATPKTTPGSCSPA